METSFVLIVLSWINKGYYYYYYCIMFQPVQVMNSHVTTASVSWTSGDVIGWMTLVTIAMRKDAVYKYLINIFFLHD
jgi:hypothetical protein